MTRQAALVPAFCAMLIAAGALEAHAQQNSGPFRSQMGNTPQFGARQPISGNPGAPADWRGTAQSRQGAPSNFRGTSQTTRGQSRGPQTRPTQQAQQPQQTQTSSSTLRNIRNPQKRQETKRIDPRDVYRLGGPVTREGAGEGGGGGGGY